MPGTISRPFPGSWGIRHCCRGGGARSGGQGCGGSAPPRPGLAAGPEAEREERGRRSSTKPRPAPLRAAPAASARGSPALFRPRRPAPAPAPAPRRGPTCGRSARGGAGGRAAAARAAWCPPGGDTAAAAAAARRSSAHEGGRPRSGPAPCQLPSKPPPPGRDLPPAPRRDRRQRLRLGSALLGPPCPPARCTSPGRLCSARGKGHGTTGYGVRGTETADNPNQPNPARPLPPSGF